jgi:serine/threonine protein kinase
MSSIGSLHRLLELGRGGMARVWLAMSMGGNGFRKLVVVKQLRPEFERDERVRAMFLEEARLAAKLNHPNTVQTLEVAEQDGEFFIVMEYLDGQPLDAISRLGSVPMGVMLAILADVCAGLHHAHELRDLDGAELGIVHRDVSPQNVFVTYTGQVKVVDFGIAKTMAGPSVSQAGEIKGKANYMAPEQALGMSVDRRADIFSVGVMLYAALAGRRLWEGTPENKVIERLRVGDIPKLVPRPSSLNAPGAELMAICNKCIAAAARDRYDTALEVQVALEEFAKKNGGMHSRGELGSFLCRAFEEHRARRQSVIEEKVRSLSDGTLLSNSVKRHPSVPPRSAAAEGLAKLKPAPPRLRRPDSSQNLTAIAPMPSSTSVPAMSVPTMSIPEPTSVSSAQLEQAADGVVEERLSRVPTERPPAESQDVAVAKASDQRKPTATKQAAKGTWRMPEPYKLVSRLSQSALIFEAKDMTTKRGVTVQLLKGALSEEQLKTRYGAAARLRHPNTVRLVDVGSIKTPVPVTYIVRENVVGKSLASQLESGPIDPVVTLRLAVGILESLVEAHEQGLIHGRLTPSHVLLEDQDSEHQHVKVLGYWPSTVAVRKQEDESFQGPGPGERPSVQGDLYAVGQIIHACLTGSAYDGSTPVMLDDPRMEVLLARALEREPNQRFQSAGAMLDAIRRVDWTCPTYGVVLARDRYFCGAVPAATDKRLPVLRNELSSRRPVSVWVFDGDPTLGRSHVLDALSDVSGHMEVRHLGEADRELAIEELVNGKVSAPWIVIFGTLHVVLEDPLLRLLKTTPETSRVLVSPHEDYELLHRSVNDVGLDAQLFEYAEKDEVLATITKAVSRTRIVSEGYDAIRLQLRRSRDELGQRSREFAATDNVN